MSESIRCEARLAQLQTNLEQARSNTTLAGLALVMALGLLVILSLNALRHQISIVWPALSLVLAAASVFRFLRYRREQSRTWRLHDFYTRALQRIQGTWMGEGANGEEFSHATHHYAKDLNVFGEGSLFELLCTARTAIGRRGLAEYLLKAPAIEETQSRQEAVHELQDQVDLREKVALLGDFEFFDSKWETFAEWLDTPPVPFSRPLQIAAFITSSLVAIAILLVLIGIVPWSQAIPQLGQWVAPLLVFHVAVGLVFRDQVNAMIVSLRPISTEIQVLRDGLRLLEQHPFQSAKLRKLTGQVRNSAKSIRKLERLLNALNERNKEWFYIPSLPLLAGTQLCMAVEKWRIEHRETLRIWLDAWAEFEALNALATYAFENPESTFPEFSTEETKFEGEALGHPLLPIATCVRNDIELNQNTQFYVISGSNMSGKSTLMRAIGLNAVLAFAGAPVRGKKLCLSRLSICASLSVVDSLLNGKSKFMAEVDRLRQSIETALNGESVLFLIDEIFAGTNSRDRRIAAEAVVRTLVNRGAIGALSTHDLALSEIATLELHGVNVHTGSRDGTDPMDFDYLLKPGITTETNALAIARMAGVPI